MTQLTNAVVLVTGAAGGFGEQLIRQLLALDSRLILADLDAARVRAVAERARRETPRGEVMACLAADLSDPAGATLLFEQAQALGDPVDVLINNAGLALFGRADEAPDDARERLMQVNLLAPMRLTALFAPPMIARRAGHIVNISSIFGWTSFPGLSAYSASKFGLRGFSEGLWRDLAPHNVHVTTVYPYWNRTAILKSPRYGTLATQYGEIPASDTGDPAATMAAAIRGVQQNQRHVFPDRMSRVMHLLKRYAPPVLEAFQRNFERRVRK